MLRLVNVVVNDINNADGWFCWLMLLMILIINVVVDAK